MSPTNRADPIDDIARQARQGSVAAIIQVLNEKLADSGVRTRAMFADGVLQLLCEAATSEQLTQTTLVVQIRRILEAIAPRNIRRVNINSRIVREQQLLWLEEITRDPEGQLLWSEEIVLAQPNIFKQLAEAFQSEPAPKKTTPRNYPTSTATWGRKGNQFWLGIFGGASLVLVSLFAGWLLYEKFGPKQPIPVNRGPDRFVEAVRLAEQASAAGKTAQSSAQWLDLASKWEKAADLMSLVPASDPRYQTAQNRIGAYRQNSQKAQKEAQRRRSPN